MIVEHFTQILWKSSIEVGVAFVYKDKTNYFAAIYKPIGNMAVIYVENVGKPIPETHKLIIL